jgi:hypothetical protein
MANTNVLDGIIKDIETRLDSADINPERVNL